MTLIVNVHIGLTNWSGSSAFAVGNRVANGGNAYQCITAGTSATTGGPATTAANITDGTAHWKYLSAIDYASLPSLQASLPATFTQPIVWRFWNDGTITIPGATSPYLTLSGHTTSPTNTLTLTCAPGESIRDSLLGGHTALNFNAAAGASFTFPTTTATFPFNFFDISDANVIVDGLQFQDPNATSGCTILQTESAATSAIIRNCIFDGYAQGGGAAMLAFSAPTTLTNCLVVDRQPAGIGVSPVVANNTATIVNCTTIALNSPTGATAFLSNSTTVGGSIVRNSVCTGYPAGIAQTGNTQGAVSVDHCATSSASIGSSPNTTLGAGNLTSITAATNFVSTTNDFRLLLGGACVDAGIADTTDIPAATDIAGLSRPQGPAWDIGAWEMPAVAGRAAGAGFGKAAPGQSAPGRGTDEAAGRGRLVVTKFVAGTGVAIAAGRAAGTFAQPIPGRGTAMDTGRPRIAGAQPIVGTGLGSGSGRPPLQATAKLTNRGRASASGRTAISAALPLNAAGAAKSTGRAPGAGALPVAARGSGTTKGPSSASYIANMVGRGTSKDRGTSIVSAPARLTSIGTTEGKGRSQPLYAAPPQGPFGLAAAAGLAGPITVTTALAGTSRSKSTGVSTYGSNIVVLFGAGRGEATGKTALSLAAAFLGRGASTASGTAVPFVSKPLNGTGAANARGAGLASYNAFMPSRGLSQSKAKLTPPTVIAALQTAGTTRAAGRAGASYQIALATPGKAKASGTAAISATQPLIAAGIGQGTGQTGSGGLQRANARSLSAGYGAAPLQATVAFASRTLAAGRSRSTLTAGEALTAGGLATTMGRSLVANVAALNVLGISAIRGRAGGSFTTSLTSLSPAAGTGTITTGRVAGLVGLGTARDSGRSATITTLARLLAAGRAAGVGQSNTIGFAPVALLGAGQAKTFGAGRLLPTIPLRGAGAGLTEGRAVAALAALLASRGVGAVSGRLSIGATTALQARGQGRDAGSLYNRLPLATLGRASGFGAARVAGYYNVTPDVAGPRLATLTQLPAFDAMDIGDVDFFTFDWSARTAAVGDPITSATVTATPSGLPVGTAAIVGDFVQVRCGPSLVVQTFSLRCSVTTRSGRVLNWSAALPVDDF